MARRYNVKVWVQTGDSDLETGESKLRKAIQVRIAWCYRMGEWIMMDTSVPLRGDSPPSHPQDFPISDPPLSGGLSSGIPPRD